MKDAFTFRIEILKKELDTIDNSMRKIDDIGNSIKNWAIITWAGSISIILTKPTLYSYILFTAFLPILFMLTDAHWRKIQRRFAYRQKEISDFLNSDKLDISFKKQMLDFKILDPIAKNSSSKNDFSDFISILRILSYPTVSLIYIGLCIISIVLTITLTYFPPI
ncbi:MAG TPA: hypothetical protein EYG89_02205 [Bacteroidia bacterium]|nr:hypothetical protein [Bacteroidia bacterium]